MDYSVILAQISANQQEIINLITNIKELLSIVTLLGSIYFIYIFIRNLIRSR